MRLSNAIMSLTDSKAEPKNPITVQSIALENFIHINEIAAVGGIDNSLVTFLKKGGEFEELIGMKLPKITKDNKKKVNTQINAKLNSVIREIGRSTEAMINISKDIETEAKTLGYRIKTYKSTTADMNKDVTVNGHKIQLTISGNFNQSEANKDLTVKDVDGYFKRVLKNYDKFVKQLAKEMRGHTWQETENNVKLSERDILKKIKPKNLSFQGRYPKKHGDKLRSQLWFDDGDLYYGHTIVIDIVDDKYDSWEFMG